MGSSLKGKRKRLFIKLFIINSIASSLATNYAMKKFLSQIGCMITKLTTYPNTCKPNDVEITLGWQIDPFYWYKDVISTHYEISNLSGVIAEGRTNLWSSLA